MSAITRKIVVTGVLGALSIVLSVTPLGFFPMPTGVSLTTMHIPVILGAVLEGPIVGIATGFIFGLFSLLRAAVSPQGPVDIWFVNPLVSVLPRLFIGIAAWLVYASVKKLHEVPAMIGAGVAGSLTNTALVLGVLGLLGKLPWAGIAGIAVANGLPEAGLSAFFTFVIAAPWKMVVSKKRGSSI
jgi:uncharacterized membrane protein